MTSSYFRVPPNANVEGEDALVKRVVGLPGETIEGRAGAVYIDGQRLSEPYLPHGLISTTFGPVRIPLGRYFVLGDNRQFSNDSTHWGPIARGSMLGRIPT